MSGTCLDGGVPVAKDSDGVRHVQVADAHGDEIAFAGPLDAA